MLTISYYHTESSKRFDMPINAYLYCNSLDKALTIVTSWTIGYGIANWTYKAK